MKGHSSSENMSSIIKRNGTAVPFELNKIVAAVEKAFLATNYENSPEICMDGAAALVANSVQNDLFSCNEEITVERCQNFVEINLMKHGFHETAKAYILYRNERAKVRQPEISEQWVQESKDAMKYFDTVYQYIVYLRTYAKWIPEKNRRETWLETVDRFMQFMIKHTGNKLDEKTIEEVRTAITNMEVLPSMRLLQFAGEAVERNNLCAYNCCYVAPTCISDLRDIMYILMCGTGVGYSVERSNVYKFPKIELQTGENRGVHVVGDSREGWCDAFYAGLEAWFNGYDIKFDFSKVRPAGARLKVSGGRASGPAPLKELLKFAKEIILSCQGGQLSTLDVHDICCKIGSIVVVGGVRRCIAAGSRVLTENGVIPIEFVRVGDLVMTEGGWRKVVNTFNQGRQNVIKIEYGVEYGTIQQLECTPNHRIAVKENLETVWIEAGLLKVGDDLLINTGYGKFERTSVLKITNEWKQCQTYDIEVEENHNFVCENILVHNSAQISLSNLDDRRLRNCKHGQFFILDPQRFMANNSAVYMKKPSKKEFTKEWEALKESRSGERGIFSRTNLADQLPRRRIDLLKDLIFSLGTNPCGEILLLSMQLCNLSTIICRPWDTVESLSRKIRLASILGTFQSTLTDFKYVSPVFAERCEKERLLGVSMTGQRDCPLLNDENLLVKLKDIAVSTNEEFAEKYGVTPSTCVTCTKPEGTVSELCGTSSGLHARYAPYYIRRVRISAVDPLALLLKDHGVPCHPEVDDDPNDVKTYVFEFPQKSPETSICTKDLSAIDQLEYWKKIKINFTEHNPSATITIKANEWNIVKEWVLDNWKYVGGLSFLPADDTVYKLAPYEEITQRDYEELVAKMPDIDFYKMILYEKDDTTEHKRVWACVGDRCALE
jgi:hypothetical protein